MVEPLKLCASDNPLRSDIPQSGLFDSKVDATHCNSLKVESSHKSTDVSRGPRNVRLFYMQTRRRHGLLAQNSSKDPGMIPVVSESVWQIL